MIWTVAWGKQSYQVAEGDQEELERLLGVAAKEAETSHEIVELSSDRGSLTVGLGRRESVATYQASLDPPYYASAGEESAEGTIVFYYHGDYSEFPRTQAVSNEDALEALRSYFRTGERPENIGWEEV